ncbi:hypothetical protein PspLS_11935 [Pyricularia sp. CBS 133598]|nr:hypothetical protein PspLS_11935 [Pyricularia sp. CBS 133598]
MASVQPKEEVTLHDVQDTLLTTLFAKARDAESDHPILGDPYARPLLDRFDVDLSRPTFRGIDNPPGIQGIASRAKAIDDRVCQFLARYADDQVTIVHIGCGLDTRALRISRGERVRWVDVDFPDVVDLRRRVIDPPAGDYKLLGCDARDGSWLSAAPVTSRTLFVAEGVLLYWEPDSVEVLLRSVVDRFGAGELIFDVTSEVYVRLSEHVAIFKANGARWLWGVHSPKSIESFHPALNLVDELDMTSPEVLQMTLRAMFGDSFEGLKSELELSSGIYQPIARVLRFKYEK